MRHGRRARSGGPRRWRSSTLVRPLRPAARRMFRACLDAGHVDALPRNGKSPGAYCTSVSKTIRPYVLMNYTERLRDVSTLAQSSVTPPTTSLALEPQAWRSHRSASRSPRSLRRSRSRSPTTTPRDRGTQAPGGARGRPARERFAAIRQTCSRASSSAPTGPRRRPLARGRAPQRALDRGKRQVLRRLADDARGVRIRLVVHPAFHPRSLLHVRVLVRPARRSAAVPPVSRGSRGVRTEVPRAARGGGSASPADLVAPFGLDLRSTDTWREAFAELDAMRVEAETLSTRAHHPNAPSPPEPPLHTPLLTPVEVGTVSAHLRASVERCARHPPAAALPRLRCAGAQLCAVCRAACPGSSRRSARRCGAPTAWPVGAAASARGGGSRSPVRGRPSHTRRVRHCRGLEGARSAPARR